MKDISGVICHLPGWSRAKIQKLGVLARSSGLEFHDFDEQQHLINFLKPEEPASIIFTSIDQQEIIEHANKAHPDCPIVLLIQGKIEELSSKILKNNNIKCLVADQTGDFEPHDLLVMIKKFQEKNIIGIEKYLNYGAKIEKLSLKSSKDKELILNKVDNFITNLGGGSERFREYARRTTELVDELILNGVFNANPRFQETIRSQPFILDEREALMVKFGFDGNCYGISVSDPFGMLTKETILEYIDHAHDHVPIHQRKSAGLGLKTIFKRLHRFIVNVKKGEVTEAICLFKFEDRIRDFDKRLKSFYYFDNVG